MWPFIQTSCWIIVDDGAARNDAGGGSCLQVAKFGANGDGLVGVTDQMVGDIAGRAPTAPRCSWLDEQDGIQSDWGSAQVVSATWQAPGEVWADVGRVGPDR